MFNLFRKKEVQKEEIVEELKACVSGTVIPIEEVNDAAFASKALGDGIAIKPECDILTAPCDGVISAVMKDSKHAIGMTLNNGAEILIHEGLETVNMGGEGFELFVVQDQIVKAGDKLLKFSSELIEKKGYDPICILVLINGDKFPNVKFTTGIEARQNETILVEFNSI